MDLPISEANLFIFIIPGFIIVWTYRNYMGIKREGEFEYLALSLFWGLLLLVFASLINNWIDGKLSVVFQNYYVFALIFSFIGFFISRAVAKAKYKIS